MNKAILLLIVFMLIYSCDYNSKDEIDSLLDIIIEEKSNKTYEFRDLYINPVSNIYTDSFPNIIISKKMKNKGFQVTNTGHGNFQEGPRIYITELVKGECNCTIIKYARYTDIDSLFYISESINCNKKMNSTPN